jgi:hypothetical protein
MTDKKSFHLKDGVKLIEKFVDKEVEVCLSSKNTPNVTVRGILKYDRYNYFVKDNHSHIIFNFFHIMWIQQSLIKRYSWNENKTEEKEFLSIYIQPIDNIKKEVQLYQKFMREE